MESDEGVIGRFASSTIASRIKLLESTPVEVLGALCLFKLTTADC
jgi:hypothetical protein